MTRVILVLWQLRSHGDRVRYVRLMRALRKADVSPEDTIPFLEAVVAKALGISP
jgi:hypothetical protein